MSVTFSFQGTQPAAGGEILAAPLTDTLNHLITNLNAGSLGTANVDITDIMVLGTAQTVTTTKTHSADVILQDSVNLALGTGSDATIDYDGTNLVVNPKVVGTGVVSVTGGATVSETLGVTGVLTATAQSVHTAGIQSGGNVVSDTDSTDDLGTTGVRWANLFVDDVTITTTATAGTSLVAGTATVAAGSITDSSGAISFGDENLSTTGTLGVTGVITAGGNIVSDTDSTDDLGTTGVRWANVFTDSLTSGTAVVTGGSITDTSGAISFGDENLSTTGTLTVGVDGTGADVTFYGDTSGKQALWDEDEDTLQLNDNTNLTFGTGADADIFYDGTDLNISPAVVGSGDIVVNGASMEFADSEGVTFGTGKDATIQYDGSDLVIAPAAVGSGDISVSGGSIKFADSEGVTLGTGNDATIQYDGSDLVIAPAVVGSGDVSISGGGVKLADSESLTLGTGSDATIQFDATNTVYNTAGYHSFTGGDVHVGNGQGLVVGHTAQMTVGSQTSEAQILGTTGADTDLTLGRWSDTAGGPAIHFANSRNAAIGSNAILTTGDEVGTLYFNADDGADQTQEVARIAVAVEGTMAENRTPGVMKFFTANDGAGSGPVERMRIDSAGHVGVGTTPGTMLPKFDGTYESLLTLGLTGTIAADDGASGALEIHNNAYYSSGWKAVQASESSRIRQQDGQFHFESTAATTADAAITYTDRFRIETDGNIRANIKTAESASNMKFEFHGDITTDNIFGIIGVGAGTGPTNLRIRKTRSSSAAGGTTVANGDSIGAVQFDADDGGGYEGVAEIRALVNGTVTTNTVPTDLVFKTTTTNAPTERMRIDNVGSVLIGATKVVDTGLDVEHTSTNTTLIRFTNAGAAANQYGINLSLSASSPDNNTSYFLLCQDATTPRAYIYADGDLANHDGTYGTISDVKYKQDIVEARSYWDDFKALQYKKWRDKGDVEAKGMDAPYRLGLVAQDVEAIFPSCVPESPESEKYDVEVPAVTEDREVTPAVLDDDGIEITPAVIETVELEPATTRTETLQSETETYKWVKSSIIEGPILATVVQELQARVEALEDV